MDVWAKTTVGKMQFSETRKTRDSFNAGYTMAAMLLGFTDNQYTKMQIIKMALEVKLSISRYDFIPYRVGLLAGFCYYNRKGETVTSEELDLLGVKVPEYILKARRGEKDNEDFKRVLGK